MRTAKTIRIHSYGQWEAGDNRHPQVIMRELGIKYEHAEPQPIADQWLFFACSNVPDVLPMHVEVLDLPTPTLIASRLESVN